MLWQHRFITSVSINACCSCAHINRYMGKRKLLVLKFTSWCRSYRTSSHMILRDLFQSYRNSWDCLGKVALICNVLSSYSVHFCHYYQTSSHFSRSGFTKWSEWVITQPWQPANPAVDVGIYNMCAGGLPLNLENGCLQGKVHQIILSTHKRKQDIHERTSAECNLDKKNSAATMSGSHDFIYSHVLFCVVIRIKLSIYNPLNKET